MINVEIKARCDLQKHQSIRQWLGTVSARHAGTDHQIDTYFRVPCGRLKLREGDIENALVQYDRPDSPGPKVSRCTIVPVQPGNQFKEALSRALGVLTVVDKIRDIFWLENVKIHLDQVKGLGCFLEIEAQDVDGTRDEAVLRQQCEALMRQFEIQADDLIQSSYSDMLLASGRPGG